MIVKMADGLLLYTFTVICFSVTLCISSEIKRGYVVKNENGQFSFHMEPQNVWAAQVEYVNNVNITGWAYLTVTTSGSYSNEDQAYAAGMAEGRMTKELIYMHWYNTVAGQFCEPPLTPDCRKLRDYLQQNLDWMKTKINDAKQANDGEEDYWKMVSLFLYQVNGLSAGYFNSPGEATLDIDPMGLYLLSLSGDMEDLMPALNAGYHRKSPVGSGSCSALVKLLPGNKDLFFAHDTWNSYQDMLRILKKYDFAFQTEEANVVPGKAMTMSSYPGVILSGDDFYLMSSKLATMETTIGNNNKDLNKYITYNTVFEGIRTMVANRLATTGMDWAKLFAKYNSGTYNNQWMIADYAKFMPGFAPSDGLFTVLEQIPGNIRYEDKTDVLKQQSYWPSYNIPYFPDIFNKSGNWNLVKKYGDWFTYDKSPRAQIFARDNGKVTDMDSMIKLMRYNDFKNDPMSRCNCTPPYSGENAISARCDLNPASGTYPFATLGHRSHGGTDMKMTSSSMMIEQEFMAISGPTYDPLPPFQWSKADFAAACPHMGHPDVFKFIPIAFNGTFQVDYRGHVQN